VTEATHIPDSEAAVHLVTVKDAQTIPGLAEQMTPSREETGLSFS